MSNPTVHQQKLLRQTQDCATALRRWLATGDNSAALMAHLRHEPVDPTWLTTYQRLNRDLMRSVGNARRAEGRADPEHEPKRRHRGQPPDAGAAGTTRNDEQHRALERVRDTCAVLRSFMHTPAAAVPVPVRCATYRQLTGDLLDAVGAAQAAGVPDHVVFDHM